MKTLSYLAKVTLSMSVFFFVGSFSVMAQVAPPTPPAPRITNIVGTITAIDTQTGEESITILPKARDGQPAPSVVTLPIDASTHIRMFGVPQASVSDLAIGEEIFVVRRVAIAAVEGMDSVPASTSILVDSNDLPVVATENESAP